MNRRLRFKSTDMIRGIDISDNNAGIDLANIPSDISFVSLKCTQGVSHKDPDFNSWYQLLKSKRPEIVRIPYHFFDWNADGAAQADNVLSCGINFIGSGTAPLMLDLESDGPIGDANTAISKVNAFIAQYRAKQPQQQLIIYSFDSFIKDALNGHTWPSCIFWVSSFQNSPPPIIPGWPYKFWQYSDYGQLNGQTTGGYMDLDEWLGTQEELNALANITA